MTERTEYKNGDEITRIHNGCDGCRPVGINGQLCHEFGCPDAWKDTPVNCRECGQAYYRSDRHQTFCDGCEDDLIEDTWIECQYSTEQLIQMALDQSAVDHREDLPYMTQDDRPE